MRLVLAIFFGLTLGVVAFASPPEERIIGWEDLIPSEHGPISVMRGVVQHNQIVRTNPFLKAMAPAEEIGTLGRRHSLEGQNIKLEGFILPVLIEDGSLIDFLLVPYRGACVHVPAPPANQMVFVRGIHGIEASQPANLFFAEFEVTGEMTLTVVETPFGEAGYTIEASAVKRLSLDPAAAWSRPSSITESRASSPK